jgi:hypothetical protein
MKKLYASIIAGKKPNEIIAAHGFHPAAVCITWISSVLSVRMFISVVLIAGNMKMITLG